MPPSFVTSPPSSYSSYISNKPTNTMWRSILPKPEPEQVISKASTQNFSEEVQHVQSSHAERFSQPLNSYNLRQMTGPYADQPPNGTVEHQSAQMSTPFNSQQGLLAATASRMNSLSGGSVKPEYVDSGKTLDNTLAVTPSSSEDQSNVTHPIPFKAAIEKLFKELGPGTAGIKAQWMEVEGRKYVLCLPNAKASSRVLADIWRTWSAFAWATKDHLTIRSIRWRFVGIIDFLECTYDMSSAEVKRLYTQRAGPCGIGSALVMPDRKFPTEHSVSDPCKMQQADYVTRLLSIVSGKAFQNQLHKRKGRNRAKYLDKTDKLLELMRSAILEVYQIPSLFIPKALEDARGQCRG